MNSQSHVYGYEHLHGEFERVDMGTRRLYSPATTMMATIMGNGRGGVEVSGQIVNRVCVIICRYNEGHEPNGSKWNLACVLQIHPQKGIIIKEANSPLSRSLPNGRIRIPERESYNIPDMLAPKTLVMFGIRTRNPKQRIVLDVHLYTDPIVQGQLILTPGVKFHADPEILTHYPFRNEAGALVNSFPYYIYLKRF